MKVRNLLIIILCTILLSIGCTSENDQIDVRQTTEQVETKNKENAIPPISQGKWGPEERSFLRYPGKYAGQHYDKNKMEEELDQYPLDLTEKQYLDNLLLLLAEDYRPYIKQFNEISTDINVNNPNVQTSIQLPAEKKVHFSILIDASGSMNQKVGGKTKMEIAKEAVHTFVKGLPKNAEISLRVYGNQGTSQAKDQSLSCNSTQEIYREKGYQSTSFDAALNQLQPAGWTPIAKALQSVKQDVHLETTESYVYVVSDGEETCGGDPVTAAKELNQTNVKTIVNIIGFDVNNAGQQKLKEVAQAGNGEFISVHNEMALKKYLSEQYQALIKQWYQWMNQERENTNDQQTAIKRNAKDIEDNMRSLTSLEQDHLLDAQKYLMNRVRDEQEYPTGQHPITKLRRLINERHNETRNYANDRYLDIHSTVNKNATRKRQDIIDQGYDGIRDTNQERYNR